MPEKMLFYGFSQSLMAGVGQVSEGRWEVR